MKAIARLRQQRRLSVDDALDLLDQAYHAEDEPSLRALYESTHNVDSKETITQWLGTLFNRLRLLGIDAMLFRRMGRAFARAGMAEDARDYILELSDKIPYDVTLSITTVPGGTHTIALRHDIAEAWFTRTPARKRHYKHGPIKRQRPGATCCTCLICQRLRASRTFLTVTDVGDGSFTGVQESAKQLIRS
jgi:hypothetical protein